MIMIFFGNNTIEKISVLMTNFFAKFTKFFNKFFMDIFLCTNIDTREAIDKGNRQLIRRKRHQEMEHQSRAEQDPHTVPGQRLIKYWQVNLS